MQFDNFRAASNVLGKLTSELYVNITIAIDSFVS